MWSEPPKHNNLMGAKLLLTRSRPILLARKMDLWIIQFTSMLWLNVASFKQVDQCVPHHVPAAGLAVWEIFFGLNAIELTEIGKTNQQPVFFR